MCFPRKNPVTLAAHHTGDTRFRVAAINVINRESHARAKQLGARSSPATAEFPSVEISSEHKFAVAGRIVDHPPQQIFRVLLVPCAVEQTDQPLIAFRRRTGTIKLPGEIRFSALLEELADLPGGAAAEIGGIIAGAIGPAEDVGDRILVDAQRFDFEPIEEAAVVKAGPCLVAVHETGLERSDLIGPHDTQIAQREVLQVVLGLAEVEVEQELERPDVVQRDELRRATMLGGDHKRNLCQEIIDQLRFGPMPSVTAKRQCPDLIFVKPRFEVYKAVSEQIREISAEHTPSIEPLSLDEAYLDVTENLQAIPLARDVAIAIRAKIKEVTGLNASAGISYNKFLAKLASDHRKPNGQFVITPETGPAFVETLPVGQFHGIGPATEGKMIAFGIRTGLDMRNQTLEFMQANFGKAGAYYYWISRGVDDREVRANLRSQNRSTPNSTTVTAADSSNDPKQPNRLEKKKSMVIGFTLSAGAQHDLDYPVFLVAELLVHLRCVFEAGRVRDNKARVDLTGFDSLQPRPGVGLHMGLPGLDREPLVHGCAERDLVAHADIDARNRNRACLSKS